MAYLFAGLGICTLAIVIHGVVSGTLQVKGGISRATHGKTFWYVCTCLTLVAGYLLWLAWYDFAYLM